MKKNYLNVITHLHSYASNGPASALDATVKSILTEIFGSVPKDIIWRECFTSVEDLRQILDGQKTKRPIDILFLTDHICSNHHTLDRNLVRFATEDRRVGIGCEIQTACFSHKQGRFLISPEVLIYGDGEDREYNGGHYTGIDDDMLARLYSECMVPGAGEPDIFKVNEFCKDNGLACALAHPFDSQQLDLEETLDVIGSFTFIESMNGGFPHRSTRSLQEYVAFHNDILENDLTASLLNSALNDAQRRRIEKISQGATLIPLGGSDAHLNHFDRVVTRFETSHEKTSAADFVKLMVHSSPALIFRGKKLEPIGRGSTMVGLYKDVIGIAYRNVRTYWTHFCHPKIWPALVKTFCTTGLRELNRKIVRNKKIAEDYRTQLNIATLNKSVSLLKKKKAEKRSMNVGNKNCDSYHSCKSFTFLHPKSSPSSTRMRYSRKR